MKTVLCLSLLPIVFLSSCASTKGYRGPERSASELATIQGHGVSIRRVDDIEIGTGSTSVRVLPGEHDVTVTANRANYNMLNEADRPVVLVVNVEAGKRYAITSKRGARVLCAYEIPRGSGRPDFSRSAGCYRRK